MYEQGKTSMIAMEMRRYNLSVLGIAETRWTQTGQFRLATGELILYSGHTHDGHHILKEWDLCYPSRQRKPW